MAQGADAVSGVPTIDLHAHPGGRGFIQGPALPSEPIGQIRAAGVHAVFFAAVADAPVISRSNGILRQHREPAPGELRRTTLAQIERVLARAKQDELIILRAPADVARARGRGRPAALIALEGGDGLDGRPAEVSNMRDLGVRSIQLVHYRINELGDIQTEPPRHGGLTPPGHDVVREMNRLGMVIDGAHASFATLRGILGTSRHPIIVSHTGATGFREHPRHLPDDLLRGVAAAGGVIGIWPLARPDRGIDQMAREIRYVARLVGIEHVAVGTDMEGLRTFTSIPTYREFPRLPAALLAEGFVEDEIRKILGGNVMRVLETVLGA